MHYENKSHKFDGIQKLKDNIILTMIDLYLALPESFQWKFISYQIDRYSRQKIAKMKSQIIKRNWDIITLEKAVEDIHGDRKRN